MDYHILPDYDGLRDIQTSIIPFFLHDDATLHDDIQIPGRAAVHEYLKEKPGNYLHIHRDQPQSLGNLILWNCKAEDQAGLNEHTLKMACDNRDFLHGNVAVDLSHISEEKQANLLATIIRSCLLANYNVGLYKTKNTKAQKSIDSLAVVSTQLTTDEIDKIVTRQTAAADTISRIMDLVNAPANRKTPQVMRKWLEESAERHQYEVEVYDKPMLEEKGFHALLAVNRGSEDPACFMIARYRGTDDPNAPLIALAGKGVTFDTGGLSIKPSNNMHYMKSDMGGAAAVFGTMDLIASLNIPAHVVGVVPCTDNSVGTTAIKPGDVISSYSGSTIEIIDTDAEGRLILADGINYVARNFKPDYLIDLATLTGSAVRALGSHASAMMTKNDALAASLEAAGKISGERVWRLPLWDDYGQYMKSDVADIRNLSTKPIGGAITAGKFLEHFTDNHPQWAHLDIAGTAFGTTPYASGYAATGYGILLLLNWIESINS